MIGLPKFEMAMAKSEANSNPILAAEDVHIITVYVLIFTLLVGGCKIYNLVLISFLDFTGMAGFIACSLIELLCY